MKILIDTNIYLNFFRRQGEQSLILLDSLISFADIENEKYKFDILLPKQIEDEYWRKKQEVVDEHILLLNEELEAKIPLPLFLESFKKSRDLKSTAKKFNALKKEVIQEYKKRTTNPSSEINKKINKLFSLSIKIEEEENILQKAYFRTLKGNPPKKGEKSFGDAIIWEMILKNHNDDDLIIISGDGDYSEKHNSAELHRYLEREWISKSKKDIKLYTNLGLFINEQSGKKKPIKKETIQEENYLNSLNSVVVSPSLAHHLLVSDGLNTSMASLSSSPFLIRSEQDNYLRLATTINTSYCTCCGEKYSQSNGSVAILGRCNDCSDFLSVGKKCQSCGKHYHDSSTEIYLAFDNKCRECRKRI